MTTNEDPLQAAYDAEEARLKAEVEYAHKKEQVTFVGGPVDGEKMDIPNGVYNLSVDSAFGPVSYVRDPDDLRVFRPVGFEGDVKS